MSDKEQRLRELEAQARAMGLSPTQVNKMREAILSADPPQAPIARPSEGVPFGQYALVERLGNGILSKMYKGLSPEGKEVALKILRPDFMKAPFLDRFTSISTRMVEIFHPNWIISHDVIREPGLALVSEYLDGAPFSINDEPVPVNAVAFIVQEILNGLSYLHSQGQHHGNLKPSNVILCRDGGVKLLDMGMHRVLNVPNSNISNLWYGTLSHMAPETHTGEWGPQTDIYAVGLLAWELLAGRPACPHQNLDAQRRWHSSMGPMAIELVRAETPRWLSNLIAKMCQRDLSIRPPHAMEILDTWQEDDVGAAPETRQIIESEVNIPKPLEAPSRLERPRARRRREREKGRRAAREGNIPRQQDRREAPKDERKASKRRARIRDMVPTSTLPAEEQPNVAKTERAPRTRKTQNTGLDPRIFFANLVMKFQEQIATMNLPDSRVVLRKQKDLVLTEVIATSGFVGSLVSYELEFSSTGPRGYLLLSYDLIHNLFNRYSDSEASLKSSTRKKSISFTDRRTLERFMKPILDSLNEAFPKIVVHQAKISVPDTQGKRKVGIIQVGMPPDLYGQFALGLPREFFQSAPSNIPESLLDEEDELMEELLDVSVSIRTTLPSFQLSYQLLQDISVGSVLPLPKDWDKKLRVKINNKLSFLGEYGVSEGVHAVRLHTTNRSKK